MQDQKLRLAENIKMERCKKHLTQAQLAAVLAVSRPLISLYETGKRTPDLFMLLQMAQLFSCTVDNLLGADAPTSSSRPN